MSEDLLPPQELPAQPPLLQRIPPIAFAIIILVFIFVLYQGVGGVVTLVLFGTRITQDNVDTFRWVTLAGQVVLLLVPTVLLAWGRHKSFRVPFRVSKVQLKPFVLALVGLFGLQQLMQGYMALQDMIPLPTQIQHFVDTFKELLESMYTLLTQARTPGELAFVVLVIALTPAICEELLFRGLVQRAFEDSLGGLKAAVITGVIFGMYHVNPFTLVPLCALGVYFGWIVYRSQNIVLSIVAHFLNNLFAILVVYIGIDENLATAVSPQLSTTPLQIAFYLLSGVVFLIASYYFAKETRAVHPAG
jgi:membrane protease YdiL (CAAX protease family)